MGDVPILFSGPMVRAILEGRKTQTRRPCRWGVARDAVAAGDRLWVRETWQPCERPGAPMLGSIAGLRHAPFVQYAADNPQAPAEWGPWRPSIHMPRWASRLTLPVVSVRAERLHDITEADAVAEGVRDPDLRAAETARVLFADLWNATYGPEAWDANPWVWRIEWSPLPDLSRVVTPFTGATVPGYDSEAGTPARGE